MNCLQTVKPPPGGEVNFMMPDCSPPISCHSPENWPQRNWEQTDPGPRLTHLKRIKTTPDDQFHCDGQS